MFFHFRLLSFYCGFYSNNFISLIEFSFKITFCQGDKVLFFVLFWFFLVFFGFFKLFSVLLLTKSITGCNISKNEKRVILCYGVELSPCSSPVSATYIWGSYHIYALKTYRHMFQHWIYFYALTTSAEHQYTTLFGSPYNRWCMEHKSRSFM